MLLANICKVTTVCIWAWTHLSKNTFNYANNKVKNELAKREGFRMLEQERTFHKQLNLYVIKQYM